MLGLGPGDWFNMYNESMYCLSDDSAARCAITPAYSAAKEVCGLTCTHLHKAEQGDQSESVLLNPSVWLHHNKPPTALLFA